MGQITKTFAHAKRSLKCLPILDKKLTWLLGDVFRIVDISKHCPRVIRLLIEDYFCFRSIYVTFKSLLVHFQGKPWLSPCLLSYHDSWHHLEPVRGVRRTQHLIISNNVSLLAFKLLLSSTHIFYRYYALACLCTGWKWVLAKCKLYRLMEFLDSRDRLNSNIKLNLQKKKYTQCQPATLLVNQEIIIW